MLYVIIAESATESADFHWWQPPYQDPVYPKLKSSIKVSMDPLSLTNFSNGSPPMENGFKILMTDTKCGWRTVENSIWNWYWHWELKRIHHQMNIWHRRRPLEEADYSKKIVHWCFENTHHMSMKLFSDNLWPEQQGDNQTLHKNSRGLQRVQRGFQQVNQCTFYT